jgi:hypothetical protein
MAMLEQHVEYRGDHVPRGVCTQKSAPKEAKAID